MDRLPSELFVAVCELLRATDIANVRLLSRSACQLATPFLMSQAHLIFKPESFERLVAISKHPIICQHITSIFYEADTLERLEREQWENTLVGDDFLDNLPVWPQPTATAEEHEDFSRRRDNLKRRPRHEYPKARLDEAWMYYQRYYQEQQDLIRQRYGIREIQEAVARMPNIQSFRMSIGNSLVTQSDYLRKAFQASLNWPFCDNHGGHSSGVPQLQSMLLSFFEAGSKLKTFECGDVSWKLFRCRKGHLKAFATALSQVQKFVLQIFTGYDEEREEMGVELSECRRLLKNGRVRDMIDGANKIERLEIAFDCCHPVFGGDLFSLVGLRVWPQLASVRLSMIETNEDQMMHFLRRHKATLQSLHLDTICLTLGQWPTMLPRIRASCQLKKFLLEGHLYSDSPKREFDLGMEDWDSPLIAEDIPKIRKRESFQKWFHDGGICPLTDEWSLIQ